MASTLMQGGQLPVVGILALQGSVQEHEAVLRDLGVPVRLVRRPDQLEGLAGLVLPGGESTTFRRLAGEGKPSLLEAIRRAYEGGMALFGTCAGCILLARTVVEQAEPGLEVPQSSSPGLGLLDVAVERNGFGRQVASFEAPVTVRGELAAEGEHVPGVFIRAPRIGSVGAGVEVLGELDGSPVLVREGRILASTFHPELTEDRRIHRFFVRMVQEAAGAAAHSEGWG